jgi:hypothetical protein
VFGFFSSVFQRQLLDQLLPQWGVTVKVFMLPSDSGISSVAHHLSYFGVGFSLCLFTGGLFLCLTPFLWDKVSDTSTGPLLSVCCDGLLIIFQFCSVV